MGETPKTALFATHYSLIYTWLLGEVLFYLQSYIFLPIVLKFYKLHLLSKYLEI